MDFVVTCPFCRDSATEHLPNVELYAKTAGTERRVYSGMVFRCSEWHIFAVFRKHSSEV